MGLDRFFSFLRAATMARGRSSLATLEALVLDVDPPPRRLPLRVGVVVVAWDAARTASTLEALRRMQSRAVKLLVVIVENRPGAASPSRGRDVAVIPGSNSAAEFSGFDEGVHALRLSHVVDVWLLANDRALSYDEDVTLLLDPLVVEFVRDERVLAGKIDALDALSRPRNVLGHQVHAYCRTNYLMVSDSVLATLGHLTSLGDSQVDSLLPTDAPADLRQVRPPNVDADYWSFLVTWLTGSNTPPGASWYRAEPYGRSVWPMIRLKIHSILNEHLLSARAVSHGVALLDAHQVMLLSRLSRSSPTRNRHLERAREEPASGVPYSYPGAARLRLAVVAAAAAVRLTAARASSGRYPHA